MLILLPETIFKMLVTPTASSAQYGTGVEKLLHF